ncbi:MAG: DUF6089 family protein [Ferruginibacter sp.]
MIKKLFSILTVLVVTGSSLFAQSESYVQTGEFGITAGIANYFGDINTRASFNRPKPTLGIFFRKQFSNYIGARIAGRYAQLGYSDRYSKNEFQQLRNLSFNTNIWEFAIQGDFNFFKFVPSDPNYSFTPYVTLGVGAFSYDPYAYLNGKKEFLRPLGTEGQTIGYEGRKPYSTVSLCIPFGAGLKYSVSDKVSLSLEVAHRYTFTDYIDDVSTTYIGVDKFPATGNGPTAALLQDRSYEIDPNNVIGVEGRQRGWSKQKDQYILIEFGVSINFGTYKCPSAY